MDKIFSRRRIKLPSIKVTNLRFGKKSLKQKIALNTAMILIIAVLSFVFLVKGISPIVDRVCEDLAMAKATFISNEMATVVMSNYSYDDLVNIYRDSSGNVTMLQSNVISINEITSSVAYKIQEKFASDNENVMKVRLRYVIRSKSFFWYGT